MEKNYFFNDIRTVCEREIRHFLKNKYSITIGITQPILWFLLLGFGMNGFLSNSSEIGTIMGTENYITYIVPGILIMTTMTGGLFSGAGFVNDLNTNAIDKLLSMPIVRESILLGKLIFALMQTFIQIILVLLIAIFLGANISLGWETFFAILIALIFCAQMFSVGAIVAMKLKSHQSVYSFLGILNIPLIFTSSAFFPAETMPIAMKMISYINPLTYAVNVARDMILIQNTYAGLNFLILSIETVIALGLSMFVFRVEYNGK
ncbi:antibiotic transport system permease protein [Streptococcus pseudoporcinus]|uniref:Transport permease protein n=1 Tax=Streptococcus pseudoporcinus TaxID=361101 RepID=A0A4U9YSG9_9STRE|nr:ABC transporter permease [Streptococcus pseudoporcinus]VTS29995.1 antibiotic transport system permease protein [Streptococcus pseudoporcinus]